MVKDQSSLQRLRLSTRCRNGPCTESGEGGCPPIDVGNGVTTESAPNIWRWRTDVSLSGHQRTGTHPDQRHGSLVGIFAEGWGPSPRRLERIKEIYQILLLIRRETDAEAL